MKSHCLPFRQIPHTTQLFLDYLEFTPQIQPFYPRSPRFLEWAKEEAHRVQYPADRRQQIAAILERQNQAWGASAKTLEHIAKFRAGALAVVTGQQVGLFGGPVFSIYKALSTVKLADEARKMGMDCAPIFWLATEDHDLEEVNQIRIPAANGQLEKLTSAAESKANSPVGTVAFGPEIADIARYATTLLGESEAANLLVECYAPEEPYGSAFAKLFTRLFADFGVILLDGSDPELDRIASPLYHAAIERSSELNQLLMRRDEELRAAGYHQQVRVTHTSTLLFGIQDGARVPIHSGLQNDFAIGDENVSRERLAALADSSPHSFSPNVLLRPVLQDYLLPTLAYVGGAAEVAYFAQAGALYETLLGRVSPIIPRFSATLIEQKSQSLLEKYHLAFPDVFHGPEALRDKIGSNLLPPNLQASFDQATAAVERSMTAVRQSLAQLDKTLIESAQHAESKMLYQLSNLHSRAARAELRQSEIVQRHAELLSNALYPDKTLQEREFAGIYFLAKQGRELLQELLAALHPDCLDHQLITL